MQTVSDLDFKHSSRKAWNLLRNLLAAKPCVGTKPTIDLNLISAQIANLSKVESDEDFTNSLNKKLKESRYKTLTAAGVFEVLWIKVKVWLALLYSNNITSKKFQKFLPYRMTLKVEMVI